MHKFSMGQIVATPAALARWRNRGRGRKRFSIAT